MIKAAGKSLPRVYKHGSLTGVGSMHLGSEFSHWVCICSGLLLIVTSFFSHLAGRVAGNAGAAAPGTHTETNHAELVKRLVMVAIGVGAVAYGVSRLVA
jgi:hypothetical protein